MYHNVIISFRISENVCRLCSSKILKLQSVEIIFHISKIKSWYDIDIEKEIAYTPEIIPFFPCVLCKSCVSDLHKLEICARKSKPSGVLLETSPIWIKRQHNSDYCIVCKICKSQKGVKRKAGNSIIDTNPFARDNQNT